MRKLLAVLALVPGFAVATPIAYEFSGTIQSSTSDAPVDLGVAPGDSFTGYIAYDSDALACWSLEETRTNVCSGLLNPYWEVTFGDFTLSSMQSDVIVRDDSMSFYFGRNQFSPVTYGEYYLLAQSDTFLSFGGSTSGASLRDLGGAPDDLLQFTSISWTENAFVRHYSQLTDGYRWDIHGEVTSISRVQVPEPGTLALFGIGLLGVAFSATRRRNK